MPEHRSQKLAQELTKIVSEYISSHSNRQSLISVTRCEVSPDFKYATVAISVLPADKREVAFHFLSRNLSEIRKYLRSKLAISRIPFIKIVLDESEDNRSRILEIIKEEEENEK